MIKLINNFRLSRKIFHKENKKIIFLCIIFLFTCIVTIIVGSMSTGLNKALYVDDSSIQNKIISFSKDNLDSSILNYAEEFKDNTIVKKSLIDDEDLDLNIRIKNNNNDGHNVFFTELLQHFWVVDTKYDTYDKYDDRHKGLNSFSKDEKFELITTNTSLLKGITQVSFEYEGVEHSLDVDIIEVKYDYDYMSPALYEYFSNIIGLTQLIEQQFTFSFSSVRDALDFYDRTIIIDRTLESKIVYSGIAISRYFSSMQEVGVIITIISFVVLVTLIVCFLNMIVILFMDKRKNMGLLKAQGIGEIRLAIVLLQGILLSLFLCSIASGIGAALVMPWVNQLLNSVFIGQFLTDAKIEINITFAVIMPLIAYLLVAIPTTVYVTLKAKTSAITLIKS